MSGRLSLPELNSLSREEFVAKFGGVIEETEGAAVAAEQNRPFSSADDLVACFQGYIARATAQDMAAILLKHPELGARAAMSQSSLSEQSSAGLAALDSPLAHRLNQLNQRYKEKFGFPFVICVKEHSPQSIIEQAEARLNRSRQEEILEGAEQVKRIAALRIRQILIE